MIDKQKQLQQDHHEYNDYEIRRLKSPKCETIDADEKKIYEFFLKAQGDSIDSVRKDLNPEIDGLLNAAADDGLTADTYKHEMALMALRMAVEARVRIMMTQKILDLIAAEEKK